MQFVFYVFIQNTINVYKSQEQQLQMLQTLK